MHQCARYARHYSLLLPGSFLRNSREPRDSCRGAQPHSRLVVVQQRVRIPLQGRSSRNASQCTAVSVRRCWACSRVGAADGRHRAVRRAHGAERLTGNVVGLVVRRSLLLTGTGIVMGSEMAIAGMRLLRSFLLTGPRRPLVLLGVAALMLAIALAAGALPAWRAASIDPAVALREE